MDSLLSSTDLSAKTANSLSGLLSSLNAMFGGQSSTPGGQFASFLEQQGGASVTSQATVTPPSFVQATTTIPHGHGGGNGFSLNALKRLVNDAHKVLEQLNGKKKTKSANNAKQSGKTSDDTSDANNTTTTAASQAQTNAPQTGNTTTGTVTVSSSDDTSDATGVSAVPQSVTDILSKLALLLQMIEKKLEMAETAAAGTTSIATKPTDDTSTSSDSADATDQTSGTTAGSQTPATDPLSQLMAFFQLVDQQITNAVGAATSPATDTAAAGTTPATSSPATPVLSDLAQLQKDLKALIGALASNVANNNAPAASGDTDAATDQTTTSASINVLAARISSDKPIWDASKDLSNLFGSSGVNIFGNSTTNGGFATVNANAGVFLAGMDDQNGGSGNADAHDGDPASNGDAANTQGLNTNSAALSSLGDGTRAADPYSFASQLSATRAANGGTTGLPDTVEQVILQLNRGVKDGNDQMTIQLHPADLGKINIKLSIDSDGKVQGTVVANNPATLDLLHKDVRSLERALQDAGLRADPGSLQFSLGGQGNASGQTAGGDGSGTSSGNGAAPDASTSLDISADASETYYVTPGRVNLKV